VKQAIQKPAAKAKSQQAPTGSMKVGRYEVPMVVRALEVLELVAELGGPVSLSEIVGKTRITKSSVYRILQTLEARKYIVRNATTGDLTIGPRLSELNRLVQTGDRLEIRAEPLMQELRAKFDETVNLGVLRDQKLVYLRVLESHRRFSIRADEGDARFCLGQSNYGLSATCAGRIATAQACV
jgi:IclR family transcriptional regulator, KDG regulon repressor